MGGNNKAFATFTRYISKPLRGLIAWALLVVDENSEKSE